MSAMQREFLTALAGLALMAASVSTVSQGDDLKAVAHIVGAGLQGAPEELPKWECETSSATCTTRMAANDLCGENTPTYACSQPDCGTFQKCPEPGEVCSHDTFKQCGDPSQTTCNPFAVNHDCGSVEAGQCGITASPEPTNHKNCPGGTTWKCTYGTCGNGTGTTPCPDVYACH
jgi:hypothetical protein